MIRKNLNTGEYAVIFKNNRMYGRYSLFENKTISINESDEKILINISDGKIEINETNCPHQICKKMGQISNSGDIIVCVPFKLLISIEGKKEGIEAVTR